jgi:hypothetical protein
MFGRPSAASDADGAADEVTSGGASFVTMVQAADFLECDHVIDAVFEDGA